ncbi:MAG: PEP-CTERM sorting domain-containing protein [Spirulinaceae cyanobacterium]
MNRLLSTTLLGLGAIALTATSVSAQTTKVDFNGYDASDFLTIDDEFSDLGLNLSATNKDGTKSRDLKLFNTKCQGLASKGDLNGCTGNDKDLGFMNQDFGNALVIQESSKNRGGADDAAGGGIINFAFDFDVSFDAFTLLDVEEHSGAYLKAFDVDGNELWSTTKLITGGDKSFQTYNTVDFGAVFGATNVRSIELKLGGSGAIGDVTYTKTSEAVPEPFSMIGAGLALGAGALLKNRKK